MKTRRPLLLPLVLSGLCCAGELHRAEGLIRQGNPSAALPLLDKTEASPETSFWKGRALLQLHRVQEAETWLKQVPQESDLYSYASKAIIYCAWLQRNDNFAAALAPMLTSEDPEIAELSKVALYEQALRQTHDQATPTALPDKPKVRNQALNNILELLEVDRLRLGGEFGKAIELCRTLEQRSDWSLSMKQRARLALARVYYDAADKGSELGEAPHEAKDEDSMEGKGEETLLQFITANPDSPLLQEAFRLLLDHRAFQTSHYAISKLKDWMNDTSAPKRAATAAMLTQRLLTPEDDDGEPDATYANIANANFPREAITETIIQEHIRHMQRHNKGKGTEPYLAMLKEDTPRKDFYEALTLPPDQAVSLFLRCANEADEELAPIALTNALICAQLSGNEKAAHELLQKNTPELTQCLLKIHRALGLQHDNKEAAEDALKSALSSDILPPEQKADILMDLAFLNLKNSAPQALQLLRQSEYQGRENWNEEQELRLYALKSVACAAMGKQSPLTPLQIAQEAAENGKHSGVRAYMAMLAADLQRKNGNPAAAAANLQRFLRGQAKSKLAALAKLKTAQYTAEIATLEALKKAIELYEDCITPHAPYRVRATIEQSKLLTRLHQEERAIQKLSSLLKNEKTLPPQQEQEIYSALADAWAASKAPDAWHNCFDAAEKMLDVTNVDTIRKVRAALQYAGLASRFGAHDDARDQYNSIINNLDKNSSAPSQLDWAILYTAGSGAIMEDLALNRYAEAARTADSIAEAFQNSPTPGGEKGELFRKWAATIRQTHFIPARKAQPSQNTPPVETRPFPRHKTGQGRDT